MSDTKKKGFLSRRAEGTARYVGRRVGNPFIQKVGIENFKKGLNGAREAMKPAELDSADFKSGLNGRYEDGGVARFAEIMRENGTSKEDLLLLERSRRQSAFIMFGSAAVIFLFGVWSTVSADSVREILMGFSTSFASLVLACLGVRDDFSRWQIKNRRIGGFREYLKGDQGFTPKGTTASKPTQG